MNIQMAIGHLAENHWRVKATNDHLNDTFAKWPFKWTFTWTNYHHYVKWSFKWPCAWYMRGPFLSPFDRPLLLTFSPHPYPTPFLLKWQCVKWPWHDHSNGHLVTGHLNTHINEHLSNDHYNDHSNAHMPKRKPYNIWLDARQFSRNSYNTWLATRQFIESNITFDGARHSFHEAI